MLGSFPAVLEPFRASPIFSLPHLEGLSRCEHYQRPVAQVSRAANLATFFPQAHASWCARSSQVKQLWIEDGIKIAFKTAPIEGGSWVRTFAPLCGSLQPALQFRGAGEQRQRAQFPESPGALAIAVFVARNNRHKWH